MRRYVFMFVALVLISFPCFARQISESQKAERAERIRVFFEEQILYLNHLKKCKKFSGTVLGSATEILGWNQGNCHVRSYSPSDSNIQMFCQYTPKTIARLTSSQKIDDLKEGRFHFSTKENAKETAFLKDECVTIYKGKVVGPIGTPIKKEANK